MRYESNCLSCSTIEIQTVHVEATIGDLGNSSENQDDIGQSTQK